MFFVNPVPLFNRFNMVASSLEDISPDSATHEIRLSCLDRQRSLLSGICVIGPLGAGWHFACPTMVLASDVVHGKWTVGVSLNLCCCCCSQFQNTVVTAVFFKEEREVGDLSRVVLAGGMATTRRSITGTSSRLQNCRRMMETWR